MSEYQIRAGNGEKEIPKDSGDKKPKLERRVVVLFPIKNGDGSVNLGLREVLPERKAKENNEPKKKEEI